MLPGGAPERIAFIEPRCQGLEHVPFNAALVAALLKAREHAIVAVYAEAEHLEAVRDLLERTRSGPARRVNWHPVNVPPRRAGGLRRVSASRRLFFEIDSALKSTPATSVVISTVDPIVLALLKQRLRGSWKGTTGVVVVHELLASLRKWRSFKGWQFRVSLALPHPSRLVYIVLSEAFLERLPMLSPGLARCALAIEHPSLLGDLPGGGGSDGPPTLRFGFVGGGRSNKGFRRFVELAGKAKKRHPEVIFEIVGSVPADVRPEALGHLTWTAHRLPLTEYVERLRALSHVVWLGDPRHYELVASGSLVDAIALGIPVICQSGPLVDHLFARMGDIGARCDTLADVQREISNLVSGVSEDHYRSQREHLRAARLALAPEAWAAHLRRALSSA